jgi:hypothetical protein
MKYLALFSLFMFSLTAQAAPFEYPYAIVNCVRSPSDKGTQAIAVGLSAVGPRRYEVSVYEVNAEGGEVLKELFSYVRVSEGSSFSVRVGRLQPGSHVRYQDRAETVDFYLHVNDDD